MDNLFVSPIRSLPLWRRPRLHHPALQAWDAADGLLLKQLVDADMADKDSLLVNDAFGALACNLASWQPKLWLDSAVEILACQSNLASNQLPELAISAQHQAPPEAEQVLIKIPKSVAMLDWQLAQLNQTMPLGTQVWLAGMVKHLGPGHQRVIEQRLSQVQGSRIERKAKLWLGRTHANVSMPPFHVIQLESPFALSLHNHPGVFSAQKLDPGARCLLAHMEQLPAATRVLDLCSGNGVLGLAYLQMHPEAAMQFSDASSAALLSTEASVAANGNRPYRCHHTDGLYGMDKGQFELILCNPPFHQASSVTTDVARTLFAECQQGLAAKGQLVVVANRHLDYKSMLKPLFKQVKIISRDPKFVVFIASQPLIQPD